MLVSLAFVSVVVIGSMDSAAAPNPIPLSDVQLHSDNYTVTSSPYSSTLVEITGEVTVEKCGCIERHTVYLTAEQSEGWGVHIVPSVIPFIIARTEVFSVLVIVPPGVDPGSRELTVHHTLSMPGMALTGSNATCTIMVMGYHRLSIEAVDPAINISDEEMVGLSVYVANLGTLDAQFAFYLMLDGEEIAPRGVPPFLDLTAGDGRLVQMWLDLVGRVEGGNGELEVSIEWSVEEGNGTHAEQMRSSSDSVKVMVWDRRWGSDMMSDLEGVIGYLLVMELSMVTVAIGLWRLDRREG